MHYTYGKFLKFNLDPYLYREYSIIRQLYLQQKRVRSGIVGLSYNFSMG